MDRKPGQLSAGAAAAVASFARAQVVLSTADASSSAVHIRGPKAEASDGVRIPRMTAANDPQQLAPVLAWRNLSKTFGKRLAVRPEDGSLEAGEHLAITGPSGSGKTTLLKLLAGLQNPSSGEIWQDGRLVSRHGWQQPAHKRRIGFLFQELGLWPHLSVRQHIEFALPHLSREKRAPLVDALLEDCRLTSLARRQPRALSGGERQRVALARAAASSPQLLFLDEPLTNLDPRLRDELLEWAVAYGRRPGVTLVVVTHDHEIAGRIGKRAVEL